VKQFENMPHRNGNSRVIWHYTVLQLPPGRGDISAFTKPIKAGTRFSDPKG